MMVKGMKGWGGTGISWGVDMVRKKFPEKGPLVLVLGRALGGSRGCERGSDTEAVRPDRA